MAHKFSGLRVADILRSKKASIRTAPLPSGAPSWQELEGLSWDDIEDGARQSLPGYKMVRKLLSDQRFDR